MRPKQYVCKSFPDWWRMESTSKMNISDIPNVSDNEDLVGEILHGWGLFLVLFTRQLTTCFQSGLLVFFAKLFG